MLIIDLEDFRSGFCDRLKKITFYAAYAKINGIKTIYIFEKKTKECPFLFTDLCYFINLKIKRITKLPINFQEKFRLNEFNSNINIINCSFFLRDLPKKKLILFLSEWKKSYKSLRPKKIIQLKINKILLNKKINIGLHFRLTDKLVSLKEKLLELPWKDTVTQSEFIKFKNNILKNLITSKDFFFIAADNGIIKREIINKLQYNNKNYVFNESNYDSKKFRQTTGVDFIIDLFLLSECREVYTSGGGVPDTAHMISKKNMKLIKWNKSSLFFVDVKVLSLLIYKTRKLINFILK